MKHLILAVFLSFAVLACSQLSGPTINKITDENYLRMYYWDLVDARDNTNQRIGDLFIQENLPVRIVFDETRFFVSNTCNKMSGSYALQQDSAINFGEMVSTMMHCPNDKLNLLDQKIRAILPGTYSYSLLISDGPKLVLRKAKGETLHFWGVPTPETRYGSVGETIFLEVAPQTKVCSHPLNPTAPCLQVREVYYNKDGIKTGSSGDFENLYQTIEGYMHTPGTRNILRVKRYKIPDQPITSPHLAYVLDMVIESETVTP